VKDNCVVHSLFFNNILFLKSFDSAVLQFPWIVGHFWGTTELQKKEISIIKHKKIEYIFNIQIKVEIPPGSSETAPK
jgi:hypothetical protein